MGCEEKCDRVFGSPAARTSLVKQALGNPREAVEEILEPPFKMQRIGKSIFFFFGSVATVLDVHSTFRDRHSSV